MIYTTLRIWDNLYIWGIKNKGVEKSTLFDIIYYPLVGNTICT